jgi:hypothetical protein
MKQEVLAIEIAQLEREFVAKQLEVLKLKKQLEEARAAGQPRNSTSLYRSSSQIGDEVRSTIS